MVVNTMIELQKLAHKEPDWGKFDPEMIEPVQALRQAGWKTFACCSGHGVKRAWIRVLGRDAQSIAEDFNKAGYNQFNVSIVYSYSNKLLQKERLGEMNLDHPLVFLEIQAWGCVSTAGFAIHGGEIPARTFANSK